jgi:hypothetical protein
LRKPVWRNRSGARRCQIGDILLDEGKQQLELAQIVSGHAD